ncbi:MAG: DUF1800 domain-containing protein, partial [Pseudomonadota bacterium]
MHRFDPHLAEIRFGYGLSPVVGAPSDAAAMLDGVIAPDHMAQRYPTEDFQTFLDRAAAVHATRIQQREHRGTALEQAAKQRRKKIKQEARRAWIGWAGHTFLRRIYAQTAFRERLVAFWADHFTARGTINVYNRATTPYVDDAIRPSIALRFADLLQASVMHPLMLDYLDQARSMGPQSAMAKRRAGRKASGLNENLAREVLELHTLGVDGPYTQADVTELAKLFAGMSFQVGKGYHFRAEFVEPGTEFVLGRSYPDAGGDSAVRAALEDLSVHPATARHIAWKLAVHFTSDDPDAALIDALEHAFLGNDGALMPVYDVLLNHPAAWHPTLVNCKPPIDFVSSALRALAPAPEVVTGAKPNAVVKTVLRPLATMGQVWEKPVGPDGWSERDGDWMTPQGMAARVTWAMQAPPRIKDPLPDPRDFVNTALGQYVDEPVRFAARAAESRSEAIGLILMSPAFQRR